MAEQAGGGNSNNNDDTAQPSRRTIRSREGHARFKVKAEFFYADGRLVAYINPGWIQYAFGMLTGLLNWVGLQTNV